ncbi:MAG TPA: hypothetical protein VMR45_02060 [Patescibacteria group bacterium]|nr:hypothetical protein [Patescibacteria group bacterium]
MPTAVAEASSQAITDHPDLVELGRRLNASYGRLGSVALRGVGLERADSLPGFDQLRQEYVDFVGPIVCRKGAEAPAAKKGDPLNSLDMLHGAAAGKPECEKALHANASTDVWEIFADSGDGLEVEAEMNDNGEVVQMGQTTNDRTKNTLLWHSDLSPGLTKNTIVEGQNGHVIEGLWRQGQLKGKKAVEFSLVPDNAPHSELAGYGYFVDSMIIILRTTQISPQGKVKINSLLVGGVDQEALPKQCFDDSELDEVIRQEQAFALRFDIGVMREMLTLFGVEGACNMSTTDMLEAVMTIPDRYDSMDILHIYDSLASQKLGKPVFWGSTELGKKFAKRPPSRADYQAHWDECQKRHVRASTIINTVVQEAKARHAEPQTPLEALKLNHDIAKKHAILHSIENTDIDARRTFGRQAQPLVEMARHEWHLDNTANVNNLVTKIEAVAVTTGCISAKQSRGSGGNDNKMTSLDLFGDDKSAGKDGKGKKDKAETNKSGKREVMRCVTCPLCDRNPVDAFIDYYPDKNKKRITCSSCSGCKWYDT